jgi:hypothetical protein
MITEGGAIRFKVRYMYYAAWTSTAQRHTIVMWEMSRDSDTFSDPESWICPPTPGQSPYNALKHLFDNILGRVGNFSQRERLGFNNVIMLAQLDRAFVVGVLPTSWRPCVEELLSNGKNTLSHVRDSFKADNALQCDLIHLYPECNTNPQPYRAARAFSELHSTQTSRLAGKANDASGNAFSLCKIRERVALQELDESLLPLTCQIL